MISLSMPSAGSRAISESGLYLEAWIQGVFMPGFIWWSQGRQKPERQVSGSSLIVRKICKERSQGNRLPGMGNTGTDYDLHWAEKTKVLSHSWHFCDSRVSKERPGGLSQNGRKQRPGLSRGIASLSALPLGTTLGTVWHGLNIKIIANV